MSKIVTVPISKIEINPYRKLHAYPYNETKLAVLQASINDLGLWEGVIAREQAGKFELAFGHHRVEAARRVKLKEIPLVVRSLTDQQMLQFMGRENMEDYRADFLISLETWEAGMQFLQGLSRARDKKIQPLDCAKLLGWISHDSSQAASKMSHTARACHAAYALIVGGHLAREDFQGLSVKDAEAIAGRSLSHMERIDTMGKLSRRPKEDLQQAKRQIAKGAKVTAAESRRGDVLTRDLRSRVDVNTYVAASRAKKTSPLFAAFGKTLGDSLDHMLSDDSAANRLQAIVDALGKIELESDQDIVARVAHTLGGVSERALRWQRKVSAKPASVTKLKLLEGS
jgi:hypothetical protein